MKSPIVLLTDYGYQDPYAGILHGVIASIAPGTQVIDLTHGIAPQNVPQASIYLESAYRYFPKGSLFVCVVDPGVGTGRRILCARNKFYTFLAPDNGLLSGVSAAEAFTEIRSVENSKYFLDNVSATFHGRDIFAPAAASLALKPSIFRSLGPAVRKVCELQEKRPHLKQRVLTGEILYFDAFGNGISNIVRTSAQSSFWKSVRIQVGNCKIGSIQETYGCHKGLTALWNSTGRLEIALPMGRADSLLTIGQNIQVISEK